MASTASALVTAIATALGRITTASYDYDLSGDGDVVYGIFDEPPSPNKSAMVCYYENKLDPHNEAVPLAYRGRTASYDFVGWVKAGKSPTARAKAAMKLRSDVLEALERGIQGKPGDTPIGGDLASVNGMALTMVEGVGLAIDGDAIGIDGWGTFFLSVTFQWRQQYGA